MGLSHRFRDWHTAAPRLWPASGWTGTPDVKAAKDPLVPVALIHLGFYVLALVSLGIPSLHFDEAYYVASGTLIVEGSHVFNREHPMLAKELIGITVAIFGYNPLGWRIGAVVFGTLGSFGFVRAFWWQTRSYAGTVIFAALLTTSFLTFVLSGLAILDPFMFGFVGLAIWQFAIAMQKQPPDNIRLVLVGIFLGCAVACKWSAAPTLALVGVTAAWHARRSWRQMAWVAVALGLVPVAVYLATFAPILTVASKPVDWRSIVPLHLEMVRWIGRFAVPNPYSSQWWQWLLNTQPFWIWRNEVAGAVRLLVVGGNPILPLITIPAVIGSIVVTIFRGANTHSWPVIFFLFYVMLHAISGRDVQYYHYYLLPLTVSIGLASAWLAQIWNQGWRWPAVLVVGMSCAAFVWFYPALSAMPLKDYATERRYSWLPGWDYKHGGPNKVPLIKDRDLPEEMVGTNYAEFPLLDPGPRPESGPAKNVPR